LTKLLPLLFIILWASAFVSSKFIVVDATPFASLALRYGFVTAGFFCFALFIRERFAGRPGDIAAACMIGVLFHGVSIGSVFYSVSIGLPTGIAALINSLQPVLTSLLAGPLLGEKVTWRQWLGIVLGFTGVVLVLGLDVGVSLPTLGVISSVIGLAALTSATLWQKKMSDRLSLPVTNVYQAFAAFIFYLLATLAFEDSVINFTSGFVMAMGWQILCVSFGAFTILLYLLKTGSASKTSALFFLVPPVSIFMAWLLLGEQVTRMDLLGLLIATVGVYLATRK
jgi:drug/metabolite transporter (DMT)-like permease